MIDRARVPPDRALSIFTHGCRQRSHPYFIFKRYCYLPLPSAARRTRADLGRIPPMELTHETLAECVTSLRRDFQDRLGSERRVLPRFRVWAPLQVTPAGAAAGEPPFTVWLRDLSRGGLGLMYTRSLPGGWDFIVVLPRMVGEPLRMLCSVVYTSAGAPDMHSVGARFVKVLSDDASVT